MELGLEGKRALVTGSTAGIGFATARALAAEGAQVTVNGRTETRVNAAVQQLRREVPNASLQGVAAGHTRREHGPADGEGAVRIGGHAAGVNGGQVKTGGTKA
jgi:NAD(P)-dependent dehydrogenase (short-subunit alcohol dehydrogenase family)